MDWLKINIKIDYELTEAVSNLLIERGSSGTEETEDGDKNVITGYFADIKENNVIGDIKKGMQHIIDIFNKDMYEFSVSKVEDSDWENCWKKYYKPFYLTEGVLIKPGWESIKKSDDIIIEMDPGMAFGTGLHETTKLCSSLIKKYVKNDNSIIDLGCGTGILSILARKLGAGFITALDIDETAVISTGRNFDINGLRNNFEIKKGSLETLRDFKADIFISNIIADVLIKIAKDIKKHIHTDSLVILSGIIKDRDDEVLDCYINEGFIMEEKLIMGEWVAYLLKCIDFS